MKKGTKLWLIAVAVLADRRVHRTARLLGALLLGVALEQVARVGLLPPEVVQVLRAALSGL